MQRDNCSPLIGLGSARALANHPHFIISCTDVSKTAQNRAARFYSGERIWKYNPKIKLLIILRNPLERAFAHWNMQRFKGREPLNFLDAVKEEKNRANKAAPLQSRRYSYVDRGFYAEQIERVFKLFPTEQVKIIKLDEFRDKKSETLDAIFRFLGLEPKVSSRDKDRNIVPYEREMTAEERKHLYGMFAEDIAKLEQLLGWDCSDWKTEI